MSYEITATLRELQGTGASRRLRREGKVPAVVYGDEKDAIAITIEHKAVYYALQNEAFHSAVIDLEIDGKKQPVMVRDFQMHPFKPFVQHVDFQRVDLKKPVKTTVTIHLINAEIAPAIKLQGNRVSQLMTMVEVVGLPGKIPAFIEVDLSTVVAGQIIHLSDLTLPEGVECSLLKRGENLAIASVTGKGGRAIANAEAAAAAEAAPAGDAAPEAAAE